MYIPSFNRIDDEAEIRRACGARAIGRVRHGRSRRVSRVATLLPIMWDGGTRPCPHGARQPAVESHHGRRPGAADLFRARGLHQPVVVRGEGRTRPCGADVELQRRAPVRHGAVHEDRGLVARRGHPADRGARRRAHRTVAAERRAGEATSTGQLAGIVGLEITVTRVEGKSKLSQNRSEADRRGVIAGLRTTKVITRQPKSPRRWRPNL